MKLRPIFLAALLLTGCATYRPLPLDTHARAPADPADIKVDAASMPLPALRHHVFDPRNGLDMTEVAMLAVANNPQLKLARDDLGIARAQAFSAGLLPDPVLGVARDFPISGPATSTAFNLGLSYDVSALLTHSSAVKAARASARQVDLNLLWLEWQVVAQARQLFIRHDYSARSLALLRQEEALLRQRHARMLEAYGHGDVALDAVSVDLASLQAVQTRANDVERQLAATDQALNALLGLSPRARLDLVGPSTVPQVSAAAARRDLAELPRRRPDLLALQAGYESREARVRQAILEQFPALNIGFVRARDTDSINTRGFQVSLTLPIFNRNLGNIAIERATRQRLHDEYAARLLNARADVERILQDQALLQRQRGEIAQGIALSGRTLKGADAALARGDLSEAHYVLLKTAWLNRRLDLLAVDETLQEQQAALQTLLGGPVPAREDSSTCGQAGYCRSGGTR